LIQSATVSASSGPSRLSEGNPVSEIQSMKKLCWLLSPIFLCSALLLAQTSSFPLPGVALAPRPLAIEHVNVIDVTDGNIQPDMDVIVAHGRIVSVVQAGKSRPPNDAQTVDGRGKYLVPGLWDMHVHWYDKNYLPLFIANGVTGVRMMWGEPLHHEWRKEIAEGKLLGPRMDLASAIVDGPKPVWPTSTSVSTPEQARQAVDLAKKYGADFIKVYSALPRAEYFAIAAEAKRIGIPYAGHVTVSISEEEASNAGQKSVEHLTGVLAACSSREDDLMKLQQQALAKEIVDGKPLALFVGPDARAWGRTELDTYSPAKASYLFALLKQNHTWQVPTLTVNRMIADLQDPSFTNDPRLKYMPPQIKSFWDPKFAPWAKDKNPDDIALKKSVFQKQLEIVGEMQRQGVGILAGTDTLNPYCFPGFSLHDELDLMVQAGMTPLQALQAATLNPARYLGQEKSLGTVSTGKVADLVLLDANPLDDIANTKKIDAVVYGGKLFSRPSLDAILAKIQALAAKEPISDVLSKTVKEQNVDAAIRQYRELKASQPQKYDFSEDELDGLGQQLLQTKKVKDAIRIFQLNADVYPSSFAVYQSLGDAYLADGSKELATKNYKKSLELNSMNIDAAEKLAPINMK
jgi:Amidohydrolase family